jgi:(p)ppGpp synthase/HD superfamily hydrolase
MALTPRFDEALVWASELHRAQQRKGTGIPYLAHLLAVSGLVLEAGGDEEQAIAALLHDAVEDQGGLPRLAEIRNRFGTRIATIVEGCTDAVQVPKPPWRARKQAYLDHLQQASDDVRLVSCADKLHNARCILFDFRTQGGALWSRFTAGRDGVLWYYQSLADIFSARGPAALAAELRRTVDQLVALAGA